jgi:hypothetical protein
MATPDFEQLVPDSRARQELGDVSEMTFWRWDNKKVSPPEGWEPPVRIGPRKFRRRGALETVKANLLREALERRGAE